MFDDLFRTLGGTLGGIGQMNHPFVNQARTHWQRDPGPATLWCRWYWEHIPQEVIQYAAQFQQQAQSTLGDTRMRDELNAKLGAVGISPSYAPALSGGFVGDPNEAILMITLATIRQNRGDPAADPRIEGLAERVLRHQMDPLDLLRSAMSDEQRAMFDALIQMIGSLGSFGGMWGSPVQSLGDFGSMLPLLGTLTAALALPRPRIPLLLGLNEP